MKAISFVEAKDIIGGALNPFAGLVKGAQLGYDTGASIVGMVGGVVGGVLGGAMGFLGAMVGSDNYFTLTGKVSCMLSIAKKHRPSSVVGIRFLPLFRAQARAITRAARC